mmetsp:Transcript_15007/g.24485  ORF Transcript_15007/g.24485 Transcript_15007/m.24485 type:complete len:207 (+) Transcript_15007:1141-1761(+)
MYDCTTPATGARTSMVTLSVSIWAIVSSIDTISPGCLTIAAMAPSVMESPIDGTWMPKGAEEAPAGAEVRGAGEAAAAFLAPSVSVATPCPTMTVSPSLTRISPMTPATGERTSMVTLSVSICAITSSTATSSPGALSTAAMDPSVMESPICGTSTVEAARRAAEVLKLAKPAGLQPWVTAGTYTARLVCETAVCAAWYRRAEHTL